MVVCKNCGKENQPQYKFCLYCGSEIQGEAAAAPVRDPGTAEAPASGRVEGSAVQPAADAALSDESAVWLAAAQQRIPTGRHQASGPAADPSAAAPSDRGRSSLNPPPTTPGIAPVVPGTAERGPTGQAPGAPAAGAGGRVTAPVPAGAAAAGSERRVVPGLPTVGSARSAGRPAPAEPPRGTTPPLGPTNLADQVAPRLPGNLADQVAPPSILPVADPSDRFPAGWMRGRIEGEALRPSADPGATPLPTPRPPSPFFTGEMNLPAPGPKAEEPARSRSAGAAPVPLSPAQLAAAGRPSAAPGTTAPGTSPAKVPSGNRNTTALSSQPATSPHPALAEARQGAQAAKPPTTDLVTTLRPPESAARVVEEVRGEAKTAGIPIARAEPRLCPTCKAPVPRGFQFCGQCGGRVDGAEPPRRAVATVGRVVGRLVLIRPDGSEGGHHPLNEGINILGRGSGPLFDADSYLSPLHLQVEPQDNGLFTLRDAGSLNGVFIKLTEEEPIGDGAVFRIGQELLRFDTIRPPRPLEDGTEVMGSPNPGYWGRIAIIIGKGQDGSCFPLFGDAVVLGRERGDILFSEDGYVSGTHARISYRHGQVFLQDLASSNGTFLKIRGERTVRGGTFILMGQQLFRVLGS